MPSRFFFAPILALVAVSCSGGGLQRDADGAVTRAGSESAFEIQVGDCTSAELKEQTTSVKLVPCTEPHTHEAYFVVEHEDGPYPGSTALETFAEQQCVGAFPTYVGVEVAESRFYFTYLYPSVSTWNDKQDRQVVCFVVSRDAPVTGTVKGSAQ
jgi:Septum formation